MRRFGRLLLVSVVLATGTVTLGLVVVPSRADAGSRLDDRMVPGSDPAALLLLARAERAGYERGYVGVQYLAIWCPGGAASAIVDISHVPGVGTTMSVRQTAADPARMVFAPGSPDTPARDAAAARGLLARNFRLALAGADEVAGRRTIVVEALRPGDGSVAARLWLDRQTGLALRQEVFDSTGAAVRANGFLTINLTERVPASSPGRTEQVAVPGQPIVDTLRELAQAGWAVPTELPHGLRLYHARRLDHAAGTVVHLGYSDGLSTVSVFAQRGQLDSAELAGYREMRHRGSTVYVYDGMPRRVVWEADGTVYTIIADASDEMIESVVVALPTDSRSGGVLDRVGRGLFRVGSWLNPFG